MSYAGDPGDDSGFFSAQQGQLTPDSIQRQLALAAALQQQAQHINPGAYGGLNSAIQNIGSALLQRQASNAQAARYAQMLQNTIGSPETQNSVTAPTIGTPTVTAQNGQLSATPNITPASAPTQTTTYSGALGKAVGPDRAALYSSILQGMGPQQGSQFLQSLALQQGDIMAKQAHTLTPDEVAAAGLPAGGVYQRDQLGNIKTVAESQLKTPAQIAQEEQLLRDRGQILAQAPLTQAQIAENRLKAAELSKPVQVGFGSSLVDPHTGRVVYAGSADPAAVQGAVTYFKTFGQLPPNARSPAMQQAVLAALQNEGQGGGQAFASGADARVGLHARQGAATNLAKQQAGTQVNEDTVNGAMNILNGLLAKGAAGPSNITGVNDLDVWLRQHTNDPDAANLVNGIGAISNEYARVMTGTTSGTPSSDSARNEAAQRILKGYNGGTMQAVMAQMQQEMANRSQAQRGALNQATHGAYTGVTPTINYNAPQVQHPANIPEGSLYSPSRKQYKTPDGTILDANGNPVH